MLLYPRTAKGKRPLEESFGTGQNDGESCLLLSLIATYLENFVALIEYNFKS